MGNGPCSPGLGSCAGVIFTGMWQRLNGAEKLQNVSHVILLATSQGDSNILGMFCVFGLGCLSIFMFFRYFLFLGHPEIGTAITQCFEHLENERHSLNPGQLFP